MAQMVSTQNETSAKSPKAETIEPGPMDVLLGRGGRSNFHAGNKAYRTLVEFHKRSYKQASTNMQKQAIAKQIVEKVRSDKNRFLKCDSESGLWRDVSDEDAQAKTSQALREASKSWKQTSSVSERSEGESEDQETDEVSRFLPPLVTTSQTNLIGSSHHLFKAEQIDALVHIMTTGGTSAPFPRTQDTLPQSTEKIAVRMVTNDFNDDLPVTKKRSIEERSPSSCPKKKKSKSYTAAIDDNPLEANIVEPRDQDVLFGRGGRTNHHPGNKRFRQLVEDHRQAYRQLQGNKLKQKIALDIVNLIYGENGRFLKLNSSNNMWQDVGKKAARGKTSQALREATTTLTPLREVSDGGEDKNDSDTTVRRDDEKDVGLLLLRLRTSSSPPHGKIVAANPGLAKSDL